MYETIIQKKEAEEIDMREKILEQLREEEKERRQEEYEEKLEGVMRDIYQLVSGKEIEGKVEEIMDLVQKMAFTEGYIYAIATLEEGLANMV